MKQYLKIKPELLEKITKEYDELVKKDDRVLGISIRGTDYVKLRPKNHPIQSSIEIVAEKAREMMKKINVIKYLLRLKISIIWII